ncbi:MAG: polyprenyl synthetase family protein [Zoogloeaceae bacterium]|nr:polyprenyl synthetase family protein [Zoogloeaceae bacterium]
MNDLDFASWMSQIQRRTEVALEQHLPRTDVLPEQLHEAMRYATLGGGKRVRALLAHAAGEITEAAPERVDIVASSIELIHAYSLVHDDMPCMDNDVLRRGKPTVHVRFDEATALLAGDALQTLAFQLLAENRVTESVGDQLAMIALLASASGSRGMAGGQAIDLGSVGRQIELETLELMHIHKTGALIRASIVLGARCGPRIEPGTLSRLDHFGKVVGLLFQVVDDILDLQSDTATLGKTAGKDAESEKPTYVSLLGLHGARQLADDLLEQARSTLTPFGLQARRLDELASFIVARKY